MVFGSTTPFPPRAPLAHLPLSTGLLLSPGCHPSRGDGREGLRRRANLQVHFDQFRGGKAEHNKETLAEQLGLLAPDLDEVIDALTTAGFLERTGASWKVPMLYREGLEITQGKAFAPEEPVDEDEDLGSPAIPSPG